MALIGLLIASEIENKVDDVLRENLKQAFDWAETSKDQITAQIQQIHWLGSSLTFLARGAGFGLVAAGALWVEEGARVRASYSSIDTFLHGPVEQVDENFHGVWIDLQPDTLSAAQQRDITSKGGEWLTIVLEDAYAGDFVIPWFGLSEAYCILSATIPVQMIGYQSAKNLGIEAGNMRYLDWVVK